ncbi:unnamed protein product [Mesocestoides corti]|uniref:Ras-associating domain-containing protein n=1 Tax=Mesocestoides corti TaxID=53468 RepID=A0A0R3U8S8_MESCO|nr:unnamed protein product [Mesocestoides corti]
MASSVVNLYAECRNHSHCCPVYAVRKAVERHGYEEEEEEEGNYLLLQVIASQGSSQPNNSLSFLPRYWRQAKSGGGREAGVGGAQVSDYSVLLLLLLHFYNIHPCRRIPRLPDCVHP